MANPFLNETTRDVETAIMLEQANVLDIGKAVAYTDGMRVFINTDDNLFNILPAYDHGMLKWLLWHERYHMELRHHNRFFKYLTELKDQECIDEFQVTKSEVNIIMDILVHDSLVKLFPELVETAVNNLAQMRNRNSLKYTFKTFTLEEMLEEYAKHKRGEDGASDSEGEGTTEETEEKEEGESKDTPSKSDDKGHSEDTDETKSPSKSDGKGDEEPEVDEGATTPTEPEPEHDKTDWKKLEDIDSKEFIEADKGDRYVEQINRLKRKKFRMAKLTETLNGLATSTRRRTYARPSSIQVCSDVMLKGSTPGRTQLYLCFDASGSMGAELATFKEIISKSIPQAMDCPCEWFSGCYEKIKPNPKGRSYDYYKGKFKDIMPVYANCGYNDDGDRTIELCYLAEQAGYSPIGVTDGGGQISWSADMLKKLKRTVLVGQNRRWLEKAHAINPKVQILDI